MAASVSDEKNTYPAEVPMEETAAEAGMLFSEPILTFPHSSITDITGNTRLAPAAGEKVPICPERTGNP